MILVPLNVKDAVLHSLYEKAGLNTMGQGIAFALQNIRFSIGVCYGKKDIRKAMRLADERMYAFKNGYYEAHPELKYR